MRAAVQPSSRTGCHTTDRDGEKASRHGLRLEGDDGEIVAHLKPRPACRGQSREGDEAVGGEDRWVDSP